MIKWETDNSAYANGEIGKIGKFKIFSLFYDSLGPRDETRQKLTCHLPGIKSVIGKFQTIGAAKEKAEDVLLFWMNSAGLTFLSDSPGD